MAMKPEFQIVQVKIQGERTVVLFRTMPYQPVLVPFIYLILNLKRKAKKTVQSKFTGIKFLYTYFSENVGRDLDELLINKSNHRIVLDHLDPFINWLRYNDKILGIQSRDNYIRSIREFLVWSTNRYLGKRDIAQSIQDRCNTSLRYIPNSLPTSDSSLTRDEVKLILEFSNPLFVGNPFRADINKQRNFLIINLLLHTGMRIGELLKLKSSDIYEMDDRFYVEIIKREDEEEDTRADKPSLKNNQSQRIVGITEDLYRAIIAYIIKFRRPIKDGKKVKLTHGYLFTSERGLPLSKALIYDMLHKLKNALLKQKKAFNKDLNPHSFRHTFAEQFLENLLEIQGLDMERAKDQLRIICGWSIDSEMPSYYAKQYISRSANAYNVDRITRSQTKTLKQ